MRSTDLNTQNPKTAAGFTLVELLVTTVILAIGLLGMAGLQTAGLNTNQSAYHRSQATIAISDIIDRMRTNTAGASSGFYDNFSTSTTPEKPNCIDTHQGCSASDLANYDLYEWTQHFRNLNGSSNYIALLPNASGSIARNVLNDSYTVSITWEEVDWDINSSYAKKAVQNKTMSINLYL